MKELLGRLAAGAQNLLPQHAFSSLVYRMMRIEVRWFKNLQIRVFSSVAGVNWSEAESPDPGSFRHFNAFFTRSLRSGVRQVDGDERALVSPCDGRISEHGNIDGERLFQAKGRSYTLQALLADDPQCSQWFNGYFYTIYLAPGEYHRVHMPLEGLLQRMTHVPGRAFSVAPYTVRHVPRLFARNERVISVFDTAIGPVAQVLVGAMLVSSMATVWAGEVTPSASRTVRTTQYGEQALRLARGTEMGRFNMGSTVILVLPPGAICARQELESGDKVLLGQRLATLGLSK